MGSWRVPGHAHRVSTRDLCHPNSHLPPLFPLSRHPSNLNVLLPLPPVIYTFSFASTLIPYRKTSSLICLQHDNILLHLKTISIAKLTQQPLIFNIPCYDQYNEVYTIKLISNPPFQCTTIYFYVYLRNPESSIATKQKA